MKECRQCIWHDTCSLKIRCEYFEEPDTVEYETIRDYKGDMRVRMREYQKTIKETAEEDF